MFLWKHLQLHIFTSVGENETKDFIVPMIVYIHNKVTNEKSKILNS